MRRQIAVAAALASLAAPTRAGPGPAKGRIESDQGRIEILGRALRAGDRIELPEGYLVVEEDAPDDGAVGSFGVLSSEVLAPPAPPATDAVDLDAAAQAHAEAAAQAQAEAATLAASGERCRAQRAAYLSELWRMSGIDVKDPVALIDGLEAGSTGPGQGFLWFALATDAFRPLAWSSELRSRANALARCARGG
jgi:hypothetical protein